MIDMVPQGIPLRDEPEKRACRGLAGGTPRNREGAALARQGHAPLAEHTAPVLPPATRRRPSASRIRHRAPGQFQFASPAYNLNMWTIVLLIFSNIFMTFAWYGHLKFRQEALWKVVLVSWAIALLEYCFQVPANRIGAAHFSPVQLKVIQEIITLVVFGVFVTFYFGQHLRWNHAAAGVCLVAAAFFVFHSW